VVKISKKDEDKFREDMLSHLNEYLSEIQDDEGNWTVKGFIDISKNIYNLSTDTKVISKVMEIMLFPRIKQFAAEHGFEMILCKEQNFYPDITFIDKSGRKFALDLKTTYRKTEKTVSGFTLGAFTGYFRDRKSAKNITFPYAEYDKHYVLGVIYTKQDKVIDEFKIHSIKDIEEILSVIKDIEFIFREKYKIATDRPGSGNTKNIGSAIEVDELRNGTGVFAKYGIDVFDDYWMYYLTSDMAKQVDLPKAPYKNLKEYFEYKQ